MVGLLWGLRGDTLPSALGAQLFTWDLSEVRVGGGLGPACKYPAWLPSYPYMVVMESEIVLGLLLRFTV